MIWRNWYYEKAADYWGARYTGMRDIDDAEATLQILAGLTWEPKPCVKATRRAIPSREIDWDWNVPETGVYYECKRGCFICGGEGYFKLFKLFSNGEQWRRF